MQPRTGPGEQGRGLRRHRDQRVDPNDMSSILPPLPNYNIPQLSSDEYAVAIEVSVEDSLSPKSSSIPRPAEDTIPPWRKASIFNPLSTAVRSLQSGESPEPEKETKKETKEVNAIEIDLSNDEFFDSDSSDPAEVTSDMYNLKKVAREAFPTIEDRVTTREIAEREFEHVGGTKRNLTELEGPDPKRVTKDEAKDELINDSAWTELLHIPNSKSVSEAEDVVFISTPTSTESLSPAPRSPCSSIINLSDEGQSALPNERVLVFDTNDVDDVRPSESMMVDMSGTISIPDLGYINKNVATGVIAKFHKLVSSHLKQVPKSAMQFAVQVELSNVCSLGALLLRTMVRGVDNQQTAKAIQETCGTTPSGRELALFCWDQAGWFRVWIEHIVWSGDNSWNSYESLWRLSHPNGPPHGPTSAPIAFRYYPSFCAQWLIAWDSVWRYEECAWALIQVDDDMDDRLLGGLHRMSAAKQTHNIAELRGGVDQGYTREQLIADNTPDLDKGDDEWFRGDVKILNFDESEQVPLKAFQHQVDCVEKLLKNKRFLIAHDAGLGKTVTTLIGIERIQDYYKIENIRCIISVPSAVIHQWYTTVQKWVKRQGTFTVFECISSKEFMASLVSRGRRKPNIIIVSHNVCMTAQNTRPDLIRAYDPNILVIDEAHELRNAKSKRSRAHAEIAAEVDFAIGLTATPAINNPKDLMGICTSLNFPEYMRNRDSWGAGSGGSGGTVSKKTIDLFHCLTDRVREEALKLPELTIEMKTYKLKCEVKEDMENYNRYVRQLRENAKNLQKKGGERGTIILQIFAAITRLKQAVVSMPLAEVGGTAFATEPEVQEAVINSTLRKSNPAIDALVGEIQLLRKGGDQRIIVACLHTAPMKIARTYINLQFPEFGTLYMYSGEDSSQTRRRRLIHDFLNGGAGLFFLSIKAGGTGLHLVPGCTAIIMWGSLPWSPATEHQCIKRIHRIGQELPVKVVRLVPIGTIEWAIHILHKDKKLLHGLAVNDFALDEGAEAMAENKSLQELVWKHSNNISRHCWEMGPEGLIDPAADLKEEEMPPKVTPFVVHDSMNTLLETYREVDGTLQEAASPECPEHQEVMKEEAGEGHLEAKEERTEPKKQQKQQHGNPLMRISSFNLGYGSVSQVYQNQNCGEVVSVVRNTSPTASAIMGPLVEIPSDPFASPRMRASGVNPVRQQSLEQQAARSQDFRKGDNVAAAVTLRRQGSGLGMRRPGGIAGLTLSNMLTPRANSVGKKDLQRQGGGTKQED